MRSIAYCCIHQNVRGVLETLKSSGELNAKTMCDAAGSARMFYELSHRKLDEWRGRVFRGEVEVDPAIENELKDNFVAIAELAEYLREVAKNAQHTMLLSRRAHRNLAACKDNATAMVKGWTTPTLSISPSLRTRPAEQWPEIRRALP